MVLTTEHNIYAVFFTKLLNICFFRSHVELRVFLCCCSGLTKNKNELDSNRENFEIRVLHLIIVLSWVFAVKNVVKTVLLFNNIYIFRKWSQENAMAFQNHTNKSLRKVTSQPIRASARSVVSFNKGATSRFARLKKFSLNFSSLALVINPC